jgi:putative oxidoreductase
VFNGAGKFSLDHLLSGWLGWRNARAPVDDPFAWSLACVLLGIPFLMLLPKFGLALIVLAALLAAFGRRSATGAAAPARRA